MSPGKSIINKKVSIRPVSPTDIDVYTRIYTDPKIMRYVGEVIPNSRVNEYFSKAVDDVDSATPKQIIYSIQIEGLRQPVGFVGLVLDSRGSDSGNMGVMLLSKIAPKGTAHSAMMLFIRILFEKTSIKTIKSQHEVLNKAAYFAAKSVGFAFKEPIDCGHNMIRYGIINKENWILNYG